MNVPEELKALPQWVGVGPNKEPLNPRTGRMADVMDPETWGTFEEAASASSRVGFVLSQDDPYCFIDLDEPTNEAQVARHNLILELFATYTEVSQSGKGLHLICRASVTEGARRDRVEVYSWGRYMIMTGDVYRDSPIMDQQELVDTLYREIKRGVASQQTLVEVESTVEDDALVEMAQRAANAHKFNLLWDGEWAQAGYPSQSEADFALLSMLAFYTRSNEQVRTLFRRSALGLRAKAQRDAYLNRCLAKIRGAQSPEVDVSALGVTPPKVPPVRKTTVATPPKRAVPPPMEAAPLTFPPGLVGDVARYILANATRPVREVALAGALAMVAGIVGRAYNISATGLNQYIVLLAGTGSGKEGAAKGMDALFDAMRGQIPSVDTFQGPGVFASGQALARVVSKQPCFVSVLGEFGLTLETLCDPRANGADKAFKRLLLDLYGKSGFKSVLRPSAYSDAQKNVDPVRAPNVTILGESTPETFYRNLGSAHVEEGLVPRFLLLEYNGRRPARNLKANIQPNDVLVGQLCDVAEIALRASANNTCVEVVLADDAKDILDGFDREADGHMNAGGEVDRQIWNRAHLKALKLAGVIAVGLDFHSPVVTLEVAEWAVSTVRRDVTSVWNRFREGDVGTGDDKQEADLKRAVLRYLELTPKQRKQYKVPVELLDKPYVPLRYLRGALRLRSSFKSDRRGANEALTRLLDVMVREGSLELVPRAYALQEFGVSAPVYGLGEAW